jgi:hypothetical protein
MTCPICGDKGLVRIRYHSGDPDDFGVCRCETGQWYRDDRNAVGRPTGYPRWMIWAAQTQVPHERIALVEELLDDDELALIPTATERPSLSIAEVMRTRRPRL